MTDPVDPPLHGMPLGFMQWWACVAPERPAIPGATMFDERCRACVIAMRAALENGRIETVVEYDPDGNRVGQWDDERLNDLFAGSATR